MYNVWCVFADPFAEANNEVTGSQDGYIHIRIQQRSGRKTLTTVQGISTEYDLKKIVKACKKVRRSCNIHDCDYTHCVSISQAILFIRQIFW